MNHGWNEMYYFTQVDDILDWRTHEDGGWHFQNYRYEYFKPHSIDRIIWPSQFLSQIRIIFSQRIMGELGDGRKTDLAHSFDRRGLEIWRDNVKLFRTTAEVIGAKLFVLKQPTLIHSELSASSRAKCRFDFHGFDFESHIKAFDGIYSIIDQEIPQENIFDLTEISGDADFFYDHIHPTPQGTDAIAKLIFDQMKLRIFDANKES